MSYNGTEIVELFDGKEWSKTILEEAYRVCSIMKYDDAKYVQKIEGSLDDGITYKTRYMNELERLKKYVNDFQWRIKENT